MVGHFLLDCNTKKRGAMFEARLPAVAVAKAGQAAGSGTTRLSNR